MKKYEPEKVAVFCGVCVGISQAYNRYFEKKEDLDCDADIITLTKDIRAYKQMPLAIKQSLEEELQDEMQQSINDLEDLLKKKLGIMVVK